MSHGERAEDKERTKCARTKHPSCCSLSVRHFVRQFVTLSCNWHSVCVDYHICSRVDVCCLYHWSKRPRNCAEVKGGSPSIVECDVKKGEIHAKQELATKTFTYDKVFGPRSKQIEVYRSVVAPLLDEVLMGYNCTVFA